MAYINNIDNPLASLGFLTLILAIISLWGFKRYWLWGSLVMLSVFFGYISTKLNVWAIAFIIALFCCHLFLKTQRRGYLRVFILALTSALSLILITHKFEAFSNLLIFKNVKLSAHSIPYSLYYNFDKPFIGIFPLALTIPLLRKKQIPRYFFTKTFIISLLGIALILVAALKLNFIKFDPKLPLVAPLFILANLFFVTIPEEAFFRGVLQREIANYIGAKKGVWISILIVSIFFALLHIFFILSVKYVMLVFLASIVYGTLYAITGAIESSIFCHFCVNILHFFFFTYPALSG